jgi:hypothetical protein
VRALLTLAILAPCLAQQPAPHFTAESVLPAWGSRAEALRPGMLVSIYGRNLAPVGGCGGASTALRPPYPLELCRTTVTIAGRRAGLLAVLPTQINLQVPDGMPSSGRAPVQVTVGAARSAPVMVDFGPPVVRLSLFGPAYAGMPVWIRLERSHPYDTRYPYSLDPWDFGGGQFEVKRDGVAIEWHLPPRGNSGVVGGLANGSSAPAGSPRSRLPLHLVARLDVPGRYAVRFTGYQIRPTPAGVASVEADRSEWFEFDVRPPDAGRRDAWLRDLKRRLPVATAGELAGDLLPSALAAPGDWLIPVLFNLTHWSDTVTQVTEQSRPSIEHGEQIVRGYAAACLRAFEPAAARCHAAEYARRHGPPAPLLHALGNVREWLDESAIRAGLQSQEGWAQAGALEGVNALQIRSLDRDVIASADRILETNHREAVAALARVLALIPTSASRRLLWRMAGSGSLVSGQALLALTWIANAEDLPRLGAELLKHDPADPYGYGKSILAQQLQQRYGERSDPYLRRAMRESRQLWVRKEAALPLARRGEPAAFAALLDVVARQPSAAPEICAFAVELFPELKGAGCDGVFKALRAKAGR